MLALLNDNTQLHHFFPDYAITSKVSHALLDCGFIKVDNKHEEKSYLTNNDSNCLESGITYENKLSTPID